MSSIYSSINEQEYNLYVTSLKKAQTAPIDDFFDVDFDKENDLLLTESSAVSPKSRHAHFDSPEKIQAQKNQNRNEELKQINEILHNMHTLIFLLVSMAHLVEKTDPALSKAIYKFQEKIQRINHKIELNKSSVKLYQVKKEYSDLVATIPKAFQEPSKLAFWKKIVVDIAKALGLKTSTADALESRSSFAAWHIIKNPKETIATEVNKALSPKNFKPDEPLHLHAEIAS